LDKNRERGRIHGYDSATRDQSILLLRRPSDTEQSPPANHASRQKLSARMPCPNQPKSYTLAAPSSPLTTAIEVDRQTLARLRGPAAARDLSTVQLVQAVVEVVGREPSLVAAILDDGR
jgi:hypothetical protein